MLHRIALPVTLLLLVSSYASANPAGPVRSSSPVAARILQLAQMSWHSIACVHSHHDCSHMAQHHGYPHYRIVHSHSCDHPHMLCQGGHH